MALKLFNTLTRKIEEIKPLDGKTVRFYACGPTVYKSQHIGNYRTFITEDTLRRALAYTGNPVQFVMNITDVGHLVGDADEGEDKLEVSAREEKKNPLDIAAFYTKEFLGDLETLNIQKPDTLLPATEAIPEQIEIITLLLEKGHAYITPLAIYFDTSSLSDYGKLTGQKLNEKEAGARDEVVRDDDKKNRTDFALWFFLEGRYKNHLLHWESPWGTGFPGWHIECSAISRKLLGQPFDIHAGGVDHIGTHHTNEIAQSEAAYGMPLATTWVHGEFLETKEKMSKSLGNTITVKHLTENSFNPLSFRYLTFLTHYRQKLQFSWEALEQADNAYRRLIRTVGELLEHRKDGAVSAEYKKIFSEALLNDIKMPEAIATIWELLKDSSLSAGVKAATILDFDKVLGLNLEEQAKAIHGVRDPIAEQILIEREAARQQKDFIKADALRLVLKEKGYEIDDSSTGPVLRKVV